MFRRGSSKWKSIRTPVEKNTLSSNQPRSTKIYVAYGDSDEFRLERQTLWMDVLPELQNFAFHSGFDIEWIDPLSEGGQLTEDMVDRIADGSKDNNSWLICLLGDKYGQIGPPNRIPKEEFEAIRSVVFEQSTDLKLLDQHYVLDRVSQKNSYRLNTQLEDWKMKTQLAEVIIKGAKAAFDDVSKMTTECRRRYFWSSLHKVASIAIERNSRCTMILRKFDGIVSDTGKNSTFYETCPESAEQIIALKNLISEKIDKKLIFSHIFTPENGDIAGFFDSRDAEKYRNVLSRQGELKLMAKLRYLRETRIRKYFVVHYTERSKRPWYDRHGLDSEFQELLSAAKNGGVAVLIHGPDICGKTRSLCRLYELTPPESLKIIRFIDLTYSSAFAHELWRNINLQFCALINKDPEKVVKAFTFEDQLKLFDELLTNLNDKILYLFLDDIHLLKHGPFLSTLQNRLKKATSSLAVFLTTSNISSYSTIFNITQTYSINNPNPNEIVEILKSSVISSYISGDQWSMIKQQLIGNNQSILVGEILLDQLLLRKDGVMSGGVQGRLERIEAELGALSVQGFCMYLVLSSHGFTRLEIYDLLCNKIDLTSVVSTTAVFPSLLLDRIIDSLGNMDALKDIALCQFEFIDSTVRTCGMVHLLSMYEECVMHVLHHDLQVLCEKVLIPAIPTVLKDCEQLAAEVIGRLRYTRAENSHFLNTLVEQAMTWVDNYSRQPLLVPLSCWIAPPIMKKCRTFTIKDWKPGLTVLAPTFNHQHVLISGNQAAVGTIYMYHIAAQSLMTTFTGHTGAVTSLSCSTNGSFFVSTSVDKSVRIWSLINGECLKVLNVHTNKVTCCVLASDDSFLVTGSSDSSAKVIDVETGDILRTFTEHTGSVVSLQLTVNNEFLITGSGDFIVQMWCLQTGRCISRMGSLMAPVSCISITSNDAFIVVACEDETLRVFSTVAAQELHELMGHEGRVNALACAQDDCQLFAATRSKVYCYDIHNGKIIDTLDCELPFAVYNIKISSDNFFLFSGCGPRVDIWNIQKRIHDTPDAAEQMGFVTAIALSNDNKIAACGTYDGVVAIWDLDICQCISTVPQMKGVPVSCLAFSVNQTFLLSGNAVGTVSVFECSSGTLHQTYNIHSSEVVSIHPLENYRVLSCDKEGKLSQWEISDNEDLVIISPGVLPPIFVSPNGSRDQSCKLWQISTGYLTQVLVGHEGTVKCVALADDERVVISGAEDKKITCENGWLDAWSTEKGCLLSSFNAHRPIRQVLNSVDANRLLVQLSSCAQLPILCLHNSPANSHPNIQRRWSARSQSISSLGNDYISGGPNVEVKTRDSTTSTTLQIGNGHSVHSSSSPIRPTFDKLDRAQTASAVIDKVRRNQ
ncbi:WD domain, G-beta repeat protein [Dictyocaulus viviparus]|uniref:WD domain, G-beta repeat protein n=1 Tax=Dictyocaulus viviparus TaxID=29172 RepID=A0A0D8XXX5_DICVI|nr:WD domain, G-beta repeat protein [Dictyocaulus viviparus]